MTYDEFIASKSIVHEAEGIDPVEPHEMLYDFQRDVVKWALRRGRACIWADCGMGKGQPYGSVILTPGGWKANDQLAEGDLVIASDGKAYPVTGIYPKPMQPTYRVHFSDESSFVVDEDHLHIVRTNNDRRRGKPWRVLSTVDLLDCGNLRYGEGGKSRNYDIPVVAPIEYSYTHPLISPYIMGVLLGDGHMPNLGITNSDPEIIERVRAELPGGITIENQPGENAKPNQFYIKTGLTGTVKHPFRQALIDLGLSDCRSYDKFIPDCFKRHADRISLLRGLIDTDAYIDDSGCVQYSTASKQLAVDVIEIIRSLGGVPKLSSKKAFLNGERKRDSWIVTFSLSTMNPGYIPRRANKWNPNPRDNGRWIDRIEYECDQPTICISVDSPDHSYVTESHIVTHNTFMQIEWARQIPGDVLILAPLAVANQTVAEAAKLGCVIKYCRDGADVEPGITITNYEMLDHFDVERFTGVVLDECFAKDTKIQVDLQGSWKHIQKLRVGDEIINASGKDVVSEVHRRKINRVIKVRYNGEDIYCSENHPFFTVHGWRSAKDLQPGDYLMETTEAMRLVRCSLYPEKSSEASQTSQILRSILLSELEDEHSRTQGEGSHGGSRSQEGKEEIGMVSVWESGSSERAEENNGDVSNERPKDQEEDIHPIASDEPSTFRAWGKWSGDDIAAAKDAGCTVRELDFGICYITGETDARLPNSLQARLGLSGDDDRNRGGRAVSSLEEGSRPEEGREDGFIRVEGVEILEQGDPRMDRWRDENGLIYFYDIKAERHPSFTVNRCLVHNSSIIKHLQGKYRTKIIESFARTKYKLACTATPAPNDHMELGNHAEFVGAMSHVEMLAMFFVHDGGETSKWRLKGHAETEFWRWVCSWAVMLRKPSDLGYDDAGFILPPLKLSHAEVESQDTGDFLFAMEAQTLQERIKARRNSVSERVDKCAEIVATKPDEPWLIWCNLNNEADALEKAIEGAVQIQGSEKPDDKARKMKAFSDGEIRILVSKPSICGFGMNWQHCQNVAFVGLSDSWEQYYQAVRRCWRFGQKNPVNVHVITSSAEGAVVANIKRKEADAAKMTEEMVKNMHSINEENIKGTARNEHPYVEDVAKSDRFTIYNGDCVEVTKSMPDESVHFSVFSPPFESLYTYSASDRDMGNCKSSEEFFEHMGFLAPELYRVLMKGRLVSFHCMNLPTQKVRHGYIGIRDFRGQLIKLFQDAGFIFHSEVCIWKDPVTAMQRTKALGLLHKTVVKDSCMSRQGIPDYLVTMRKPGDNPERVSGEFEEYIGDESFQSTGRLSIDVWQRYASPVWMDINPSDTLQKESARDDKDERHICPLQLQVIARAVELWSNPGDLVYSPFTGIGSEGHVALKAGRRFVGAELKSSYWKQAVANCKAAEQHQADLFTMAEKEGEACAV